MAMAASAMLPKVKRLTEKVTSPSGALSPSRYLLKITVKYRCHCMVEGTKARVKVPERKKSVDVVMYVQDIVMPRITVDHKFRSPWCNAEKIPELYLPFADDTIGKEPNSP